MTEPQTEPVSEDEKPAAAIAAKAAAEAPASDTPTDASPEDAESDEVLASSNVIGFVLAPAMLVVVIVGVLWLAWYLTYNPYSTQDYVRMLNSTNKSERWQAALDMIETNRANEELVPILIEMANVSSEDQSVVETMTFDVRDMLKTPEEKKVNLRWYAIAALAKIGGDEAYDTLVNSLGDPESGVRFYAVHGLGRLAKPESAAVVIKALAEDSDFAVRSAAAWALGQLGNKDAIEPLRKAWQGDTNIDVRWNCALSLAKFGQQDVNDMLVEMSKADNAHTREQARQAMMMLRKMKEE